jgi:dethiobiotin synthetase
VIVVVAGTGTGIGKTHVTTALVRRLAALGCRVAGRKPIESGIVDGVASDADALAAAGTVPMASPPPYLLADPVSPHLAARRAGRVIDVDTAARWCRTSSADVEHLFVETAGGLLSPLGPDATNLDLALALEPDHLVLVAPDRLGVLHDVRAVQLALVAAGLWDRSVVTLVAPGEADASTGTNAAELLYLGWCLHVTTWPRGDGSATAVTLLDQLRTPVPDRGLDRFT